VIRSSEATALAVIRRITQRVSKGQTEKVHGILHESVANYLLNRKRNELSDLEGRFDVFIHLEGRRGVPPDQIELEFIKRKPETEESGSGIS
jgi:ribonuclease E